jgi:hypothetical protein
MKTQLETYNSFAEKTMKKFIIIHTQDWNPGCVECRFEPIGGTLLENHNSLVALNGTSNLLPNIN